MSVTTSGQSSLQNSLRNFVTIPALNAALAGSQNVLPPLNQYATQHPAIESVDLNGQSITNLKTVSLESGITGLLSTATSIGLSVLMHPNTGPQNITSEASYGNKRLTDLLDPETILQTDDGTTIMAKRHQAVTQGYLLDNTVVFGPRRADDGSEDVLQIRGAWNCYRDTSLGMDPIIIQGVHDPQRPYDAVNKRSTIVEDEKQIEDPLTHTLYDRMPVGDRVLQLRDTVDPQIPTIPGTEFHTLVQGQAVNYKWAKGQLSSKQDKDINSNLDLKGYKAVNSAAPTDSNDLVRKDYCDANSKKNDGTGLFLGSLLGGTAGAISGAVTSGLFSSVGSGLASIGQVVGTLSGATSIASSGIKIGSSGDFDNYLPQNGESATLIDNLKDDIANGGQSEGGALLNGAMSISGLFRVPANSLIGLFDI